MSLYQQVLANLPYSSPKHVDSDFCKDSLIIIRLGMDEANVHV